MKQLWIVLVILAAALGSCKQNDWLDWKAQNELWLIDNAKKDSVITTPTGLQYKCIEQGWDKSPRPDDAKTVTIKYEGWMINGYKFDEDTAYVGYVTNFVSGFSEGLKKMNQFGKYEFYIPYQLGYGTSGSGTEGNSSYIPPYTTLIFLVELKMVN